MKKIFAALFVTALSLSGYGQSQNGGDARIRLSDSQIVGGLPEGIINPKPAAAKESGARRPVPELVKGWENPTYSPDSTKIAYTLNGNLYSIDVASRRIRQHTFDGSEVILNGYASWVYYEEILGRRSNYKAFWWSPDSRTIAFYRFDNSRVPMFPIYLADGQHGTLRQTRYPKAGNSNPLVRVGFVSVAGNSPVWADFDFKGDHYFGIPFWDKKGERFIVTWMDRSQDNIVFYSVDPLFGTKRQIYSEHQDTWVDWPEEMLFTDDGFYFVRDYEKWQHIYYLSYEGKNFSYAGDNAPLWRTHLLKVDGKYLFYTACRESSLRQDIYRITLKTGKTERVSFGDYDFRNVRISADSRRITAVASNSTTPEMEVEITLPNYLPADKARIKVLHETKGPEFDKYRIATQEIVPIRLRGGDTIPVAVIWPFDMDRSGKVRYPVKIDIYGGPDSQQVYDRFRGVGFNTQWWANHGVVQITLETRSAGHLGKEGLNSVYRCLGVHELEDFVDEMKYFASLPYIDSKRVGIEGYSYGGTMALLAVTEANEWFQYGIASAGVMDWSLYDTHYAERYMDRPQDNPEGYRQSRVMERISKYRGDDTNMLRLTHGTGDDNVHFQQSLQIVDELQKQNKDFELMVYPGGMHGYRGAQQRHFSMQNFRFWYKYLLGEELPEILKNR